VSLFLKLLAEQLSQCNFHVIHQFLHQTLTSSKLWSIFMNEQLNIKCSIFCIFIYSKCQRIETLPYYFKNFF
jgi:hypothetical protein